ncbi:MAG: hypothetical protein QNJ45_03835 [Ardenticatenaceae bacterium]|nr:hypothetical protein [Ardenticatenaceae bacterium]
MKISINVKTIIITIMMLSGFLFVGCEKQIHQVRYEVSGTSPEFDIRYRNELNGVETTVVNSGWVREFEVESYYNINLRASNRNNSGTVSCKIFVDGELVAQAESSGKFKFAACNYLVVPPTPTPGGGE